MSSSEKKAREIVSDAWRNELKVGSDVDCKDSEGIWIPSCVQEVKSDATGNKDADKLKIRYKCWGARWDEYIKRNSIRLAVYMSYKNVYRYPDGFQDDPEFPNSPYAHLSKDQKPIPRSDYNPIPAPRRNFNSRASSGASNYQRADEIYKNINNPPAAAANPPQAAGRANREKELEERYKKDLEDVSRRSRAMSELDDDRRLLWSMYESETEEKTGIPSINSPAVPSVPEHKSSSEWACARCTMWNGPGATVCQTCDTPKPVPESSSSQSSDKLAQWHAEQNRQRKDEAQAMAIEQGEKNLWSCPSCTYKNQEADGKCEICKTKKPLPFGGPEDYDPLADQDEDLTIKSDIWYLRYAIKKDDSDKMEKFLQFIFQQDKLACERSLVWACKFDAINCLMTLLQCYNPHINLQAAPLYYAVRNQNEHVCGLILDEMERRRGEKYTVMSMCFKEIIRKDMVDVGTRVLRSKFYHPTQQDHKLANEVDGEFLEHLRHRDPRNINFGVEDDLDISLDDDGWGDGNGDDDDGWGGEDDLAHPGRKRSADEDDGKHTIAEEQKHDVGVMSDFETVDHPGDRVQSATEDECAPMRKNPLDSTFSDSDFSVIDTDAGMQSDNSWVDL